VLVSILGQGLTIGRVVKSVTGGAPVARDEHH
jgi:CPA1 family monovalent cation:H+ antiporter